MKNLIFWMLIYTVALSSGQIFLKLGLNQIGHFVVKDFKDVLVLGIKAVENPLLLAGVFLMGSSFFLWIYVLSWFTLDLVFPMTALTYVFVALMSYFILGEKLALINYFGVFLIAGGIGFLLYR